MTGETAIRMFGMDVDGVLTDGGIYYGDRGLEMKCFQVQDGMGITLLRAAGIVPFIMTARSSEAVARRAAELGVSEVHQGVGNKAVCLASLAAKHGCKYEEIAYVGDDLSDLGVLEVVGLPIAVANARDEIRKVARLITVAAGGQGAVREACEFVLKAGGHWERVVASLRRGSQ